MFMVFYGLPSRFMIDLLAGNAYGGVVPEPQAKGL
jgi:hypothetical protein